MKITLADLSKPMNNLVVLKPEVDTSKFKYGSVEFYMPLSQADGKPWNADASQPIVCSVVAAPRKLIYGKRKVFWESIEELDMPPEQKMHMHKMRMAAKFSETTIVEVPIPGSMRWKTDVQVKPDDIVWVNSSALKKAEQVGMTVEIDRQLYYLIHYENLYLKKKKKKVEMLNGWVLLEPIKDTEPWVIRAEKAGLIIPEGKKKVLADRIAKVMYIGDPVEYLFDDQYDYPEIKKGDTVMLKWKVNRRLEPFQKFFAQDSDLIVSRRSNIMGIF